MAYISYGLDRGGEEMNPDAITLGTDDGGGGNNVTLCINQAASLTTHEVIDIIEAFIRRLEDGRYGYADIKNV